MSDTDNAGRRVKKLRVTPEFIEDVFQEDDFPTKVTDGIPDDATLQRIIDEPSRGEYWLVFESAAFEPLAEGERIPEIDGIEVTSVPEDDEPSTFKNRGWQEDGLPNLLRYTVPDGFDADICEVLIRLKGEDGDVVDTWYKPEGFDITTSLYHDFVEYDITLDVPKIRGVLEKNPSSPRLRVSHYEDGSSAPSLDPIDRPIDYTERGPILELADGREVELMVTREYPNTSVDLDHACYDQGAAVYEEDVSHMPETHISIVDRSDNDDE